MSKPVFTSCIALVGLLLVGERAHAESCSSSTLAKVNGTYPSGKGPCTLNADNYYNQYLNPSDDDPPATSTVVGYSTIVADFAGTNANGFLMKLTADRVGGSTYFEGDDPTGQPANEVDSRANVALYNTAASNGKLLVYLHGGGSIPRKGSAFMVRAAHHGYRVLGLHYVHAVGGGACQSWANAANADVNPFNNWSEAKGAPAPSLDDCLLQTNRWTAEGVPLPAQYASLWQQQLEDETGDPNATANTRDSVQSRLATTLAYLHEKFPSQGWNNFYTVSCGMMCVNVIKWDLIAFAGHSHGTREVTQLADDHAVARLILFAGVGNGLPGGQWGASQVPSYVGAPSATVASKTYALVSAFDPDYNDIVNNLAWGFFGGSPSYAFPDRNDPPQGSDRIAIGEALPPTGCSGHTWIVKPCADSLARYRPIWDWMLTN